MITATPDADKKIAEEKIIAKIPLEYFYAGMSVIPLLLDGSKKPAIKWKCYTQSAMISDLMLKYWRIDGPIEYGIGTVCGAVSGGLEVFDFDREATTIFPQWYKMVEPIVVRLPIVETPTGGVHAYLRCPVVSPNTKIAEISESEYLAEKADQEARGINEKIKRVLIETRGEGGFVVNPSSPAEVHSRNYPYVQVAGPVLPEVPTITPEERLQLWRAARSFDRGGLYEQQLKAAQPKPYRPQPMTGSKPWEQFDREADFAALLRADGWTSSDAATWRRPGKSSGSGSATLRRGSGGDLLLTVFSSDAPIPTNDKPGERRYTASAYLAHSRFGGNFERANQAIREGLQ